MSPFAGPSERRRGSRSRRRAGGAGTSLAASTSPFMQFDGVDDYISAPDRAEYDIDQAISIRVKVALDDWTAPAADYAFVSKWIGTGAQRSFIFFIGGGAIVPKGRLSLLQSPDGVAQNRADATVAVPFADGLITWVRVDWTGTNGLVKFYRSGDGVAWTQLGSNVSAVWANTFMSTADINLGAHGNGASFPLNGRLYEAIVKDGGADLSVLTDVFHADLADATSRGDGATFQEKILGAVCTIHL